MVSVGVSNLGQMQLIFVDPAVKITQTTDTEKKSQSIYINVLVANTNLIADKWLKCLCACIHAKGGHFEHLLWLKGTEKSNIEKLIASKSDRIITEKGSGKSDMWPHLEKVNVDGEFCCHVRCKS